MIDLPQFTSPEFCASWYRIYMIANNCQYIPNRGVNYFYIQYNTYIPFCMGRSKASAGKYILYFPATRAISRYCLRKWFLDPHFNLQDTAKETTNIYSKACNFYLWYGVLHLTIIENAIIFIVTDIYKQEPTSGEFLNTYFKNTYLTLVQLATFSCGIESMLSTNHLQSLSSPC